MLLLISNHSDVHTSWVEAECQTRGVPYYRLCVGDFPNEIQLTTYLTNGCVSGEIVTSDTTISLEDVIGLWYRRPLPPTVSPELSEQFAHHVIREAKDVLFGLYRVLSDRRWVNPPDNNRVYAGKIFQYRLAKQLGFNIPKTLISNNPDDVKGFFEACHKQMVYKPMSRMSYVDEEQAEHGVWTTLITEDALESNLDSVKLAPCLFQEVISKAYELRVNVIGNNVWATAIYSQEQDKTKLDYRLSIDSCRHEPVVLPKRIQQICLEMNRRMGLRMSNFDLIVTPENEYIFLETNVNGQWAWIENKVGLPICRALVDELLGVNTLQDHPYLKYQDAT